MSDSIYTISQNAAIEWDDGPILVLAGPGSGKTAVLTTRISRIINESVEENFKILALTFTNKAALEMSDRIIKLVPEAKGRLFVGTFHSFCAEVLRNHGSSIGIKPDFTIFSDENDLKAIVAELQDEYFHEFNDGSVYDLKLLNAVKYFQENLCYTEKHVLEKMPQTQYANIFNWIYNRFQSKLLELNALDFNSIVLMAYRLFSTNLLVAKLYRMSFKYVCIDEFQDTNLAQYSLIKSFVNIENSNIFVVADDDQVIYGWNGASNKRLIEFKDDFKAQIIQLSENFRCPAEVVELANELITYNSGRVENKAPLIAMKQVATKDDSVVINNFIDVNDEVGWVCDEIIKIRQGDSSSTIGVIARNNKLIQLQFDKLITKGVPAVKSKRKDEFENPLIRWIHFILKLANRRNDERLLTDIINSFTFITSSELDADEIVAFCRTYGDDYLSGFYDFTKENDLLTKLASSFESKLINRADFTGFIEDAFIWADEIIIKRIENLSEEHKDEYSGEYQSEKKVWNDIYQQIRNNYDTDIGLSTFLQEFSMVSKEAEPNETDVQCLTVHASKGKEFDYVFVIGMVEDEFPSFQSIKKGDSSTEMEEERRNCFVAITRTKQKLYLSFAQTYYGWRKKASRFLREMRLIE